MSDKERQVKNKPRKILSLEERVQALRMFDQTPVYQRVATAFQCSWEQIKNVVLGRDEIMAYYARCQYINPNDHPSQIRKKKILFLGNVVFEYIKRSLYYGNAVLDETQICERALKFRDAIGIEKFFPNKAWFNDFKRVYNIDFAFTDNIVLSQPPPQTLECQDIIEHCRNEIDEILKGNIQAFDSYSGSSSNSNGELETALEKNASNHEDETLTNERNKTHTYNDDDEDDINEDEEGETIDFSKFDDFDICDSTNLEPDPKKRKKQRKPKDKRNVPTHRTSRKLKPQTTTAAAPTPKNQSTATTTSAQSTTAQSSSAATSAQSTTAQSSSATTTSAQSTTAQSSSATTTSAACTQQKPAECHNSSPESIKEPIFEPPRETVIRAASTSTATSTSKTANLNARSAFDELAMPAQIFNTKAALLHLFPLQDFALAEEDFVAINLLEKLAAHYRSDPKRKERGTENCSEITE